MKFRKHGFTIVELLTALAIIAMLVAVLLPALNLVRNKARETAQRAQMSAIDMALMAFRQEQGYYPESFWHPADSPDYCGAQKLAEALVGWDLLGFHPDSAWDSGGSAYGSPNPSDTNLDERAGRYIELEAANAFRLGYIDVDKPGLFDDTAPLAADTFVLCDSFGRKPVTIGEETVKAGTPILYYRADTSSKKMTSANPEGSIYDYRNNQPLCNLGRLVDGKTHPLVDVQLFYSDSYKIIDPKVLGRPWPRRADSYILISAGIDGLYGTSDDITNF